MSIFAQLNGFAKLLIALMVFGIIGVSLRLTVFSDAGSGDGSGEVAEVESATVNENGEVVVDSNSPTSPNTASPARSNAGPLGSPGNPLRVSLVSFHGYAPALIANGSSLTTQPGSVFAELGLNVEFLLNDDIPTSATLFATNEAQCVWRTFDFWSQEQPGLRGADLDGRMVIAVDNTRGSDAIVVPPNSAIRRVEDLAGSSVALLQFTPSHWLTEFAIENSSLTSRDKRALRDSLVFVAAEDGLAGVRAALQSGHVQAAVLWEPDLSLYMRANPGSRVLFSTATATSLIYDGIVCNQSVIESDAEAISDLVEGWLRGSELANANPALATEALIRTEPYFAELASAHGADFITGLYSGIKWLTLEDNVRLLDNGDFARIYRDAEQVWRANGGMADTSRPPIHPRDAFDTQFIDRLRRANPEVVEAAREPEFVYTATEREVAIEESDAPVITRPVAIYFASGSAELDVNARNALDEAAGFLSANRGTYISIEGNTDSTGSRAVNLRLSAQRAAAARDYLVNEWAFEPERFVVAGNGPDEPVCNETGLTDAALTECRDSNRRTDVAVYNR